MSYQLATDKCFDFIVVGGGAAGLVLATRLSENPSFNVLILEAGADRRDDPFVRTPGLFLQLYGKKEYDWDFLTVPQEGFAGEETRLSWPRGNGLGGSAMINFMMYSHCSKGDLDAWKEVLGDRGKGWGWEDLLPYFQKVEKINLSQQDAREALNLEYIQPDLRGKNGLIQTSFPKDAFTWLQRDWARQGKVMTYPNVTDPRTGSSLGLFSQLCTVDPDTAERCYPANTYLTAAEGRNNLTVLTETVATKIVFDGTRAIGVEIEKDGRRSTITASKEVVLSAGSIQTPQILELSGVGDKAILKEFGIEVVVENPNVGENLMDHLLVPLAWEAEPGTETMEALRDHPELIGKAMQLYAEIKGGPMAQASVCTGFLSKQIAAPSADIERSAREGPALPGAQRDILLSQLEDAKEAAYQIVALPTGMDPTKRLHQAAIFMHSNPGPHIAIGVGSTHPFSRGSVHISSSSPHTAPSIDPKYFSNPADLDLLAHGILHAQKIARTAPFGDKVKKDENGDPIFMQGFPRKIATLDEARDWTRKSALTMYHPVGTAAMAPRDQGGVVDEKLKVYGTQGLRIVDASIFPLHVQGNIISLVYAIAEKAADMIKQEYA